MRTSSGPVAIGHTNEPTLRHFLQLDSLHTLGKQTLSDVRERGNALRWKCVQIEFLVLSEERRKKNVRCSTRLDGIFQYASWYNTVGVVNIAFHRPSVLSLAGRNPEKAGQSASAATLR